MSDAAKRQIGFRLLLSESPREELAASRLLERRRLVLGGHARDGVGDEGLAQPEPIVGGLQILTRREADFLEGRVKQIAGVVPGEWPARAVRALQTGRESDDDQARSLVAPIGDRVIMPVGMEASC